MLRCLRRPDLASSLLVGLALFVGGCGAGPYSHSPHYVPLDQEDKAVAGAREYDPVMFERRPDEWRKTPVSLFGVVTSRTPGPSGTASVLVHVRRLEPRNLCESLRDDSTCRVTVSDREFGIIHALLTLRPEDDVGRDAIGPGSLLRLVATSNGEYDPADGAPVLRAAYYRHFPRFSYVTKADARDLRQ